MTQSLARFDTEGFHELGRDELTGLAAVARRIGKRGGFVWVGVLDPEEGELDPIAEEFGLHPLAVADAVTGRQQPKVQRYDEHLFVVLWSLTKPDADDPIKISQVLIFVGEGLLLTVQHTAGGEPIDTRAVLDEAFGSLEAGTAAALYAVMGHIVLGYTNVADSIEKQLEQIEERVFDERVKDDGRAIYRLRQEVGRVHRAIAAAATALEAGREHLNGLTVGRERLEPYFRDLLDDLVGTSQVVGDQDDALDGVLASHENNVSLRQNDDMRTFSAFAALLSVPTVIAGLYGMNFSNLPAVKWQFGWIAITGAIVVIDAALYLVFKRRHWL